MHRASSTVNIKCSTAATSSHLQGGCASPTHHQVSSAVHQGPPVDQAPLHCLTSSSASGSSSSSTAAGTSSSATTATAASVGFLMSLIGILPRLIIGTLPVLSTAGLRCILPIDAVPSIFTSIDTPPIINFGFLLW